VIATTYRGALRVSEALALRPHDVDLDSGTVRVLSGKGGRHRLVAIDGEAVALLRAWIERRRSLGLTGRQPLFSTLNGKRPTPPTSAGCSRGSPSKPGSSAASVLTFSGTPGHPSSRLRERRSPSFSRSSATATYRRPPAIWITSRRSK
jgi:integrase